MPKWYFRLLFIFGIAQLCYAFDHNKGELLSLGIVTVIFSLYVKKENLIIRSLNRTIDKLQSEVCEDNMTHRLCENIIDKKEQRYAELEYAQYRQNYSIDRAQEAAYIRNALHDLKETFPFETRLKKMRIYWPEEFAAAEQNSTNQA